MQTQDEFLQQYAPDGNLTAEQAAQLIQLPEGDTGVPEKGGEPSATPEQNDEPEVVADDNEPDPANTVILARDGVHTIGYDKLVEAREGEKAAKAALEAANAELESLRASAQQRADAGQAPTQADANLALAEQAIEQGFDPGIFGDFSEEAIAKGVQTLVDQRVEAALAKALKPIEAQQQQDVAQAHFAAIFERHPDAESIAESKELADWIAAQPSFARAGLEAVLKQGTASEVVEMLDAFKSSTGRTQPATDPKAAARAAVSKAQAPVPASLSDIPGGAAGPTSKFEAMQQMSDVELTNALMGMSEREREQWFNSQI